MYIIYIHFISGDSDSGCGSALVGLVAALILIIGAISGIAAFPAALIGFLSEAAFYVVFVIILGYHVAARLHETPQMSAWLIGGDIMAIILAVSFFVEGAYKSLAMTSHGFLMMLGQYIGIFTICAMTGALVSVVCLWLSGPISRKIMEKSGNNS